MVSKLHNLLFINVADANEQSYIVVILLTGITALAGALIYIYKESKEEREKDRVDRMKINEKYEILSKQNTEAFHGFIKQQELNTYVLEEIKQELQFKNR